MYELRFDSAQCSACTTFDCLAKCQYMRLDKDAAQAEMQKLIRGEDSAVLRDCATCYACEEYCTWGNHPFYFIQEQREERGILTAPRAITQQWINMCEPVGKSRIGKIQERALSHCFVGPLRRIATGVLFDDIASSFVLGADFFCNVVYTHFAKPSVIKERLPRIVENYAQLGIKELICLHDECYASYKSLAPAYGIDVPFRPVHYFEYLYNRLRELKDRLKPLPLKVVYQRPCSSRLIPETVHYVDDILALLGVERLEREYQGEHALCCGEIIRMVKGYQVADDLQNRNIDDMVKSGATACVFNCPYCYLALAEKTAKRGVMPIHLIDLCKIALDEKPAWGA